RWPIRTVAPDGSVRELMAVEGDTPLYLATHNTAAAISTAVTPLHSAPFSLTGNGLTVGVWDGGAVRPDHQEFGGRVTVMDGGANGDHATHVGGTIIAAGVSSAAKGMAPLALVESYDWNDDIAEML